MLITTWVSKNCIPFGQVENLQADVFERFLLQFTDEAQIQPMKASLCIYISVQILQKQSGNDINMDAFSVLVGLRERLIKSSKQISSILFE